MSTLLDAMVANKGDENKVAHIDGIFPAYFGYMQSQRQKTPYLWYTRKSEQIQGPFPLGLIQRWILLGRLTDDDEVSSDKKEWQRVQQHPELIPEVMRNCDSPEAQERLNAARRREDERTTDRRQSRESVGACDRRGRDRRKAEGLDLKIHRVNRQVSHATSSTTARSSFFPLALLIGLLIALWSAGVFVYTVSTNPTESTSICEMKLVSEGDFSNCALEGLVARGANLTHINLTNSDLHGADLHRANLVQARLAYANLSTADLSYAQLVSVNAIGAALRSSDLSNANLQDANFSYSDLRGANLGGANLSNARFDKAIWLDGTECAVGSLGGCVGVD